MAADGAHIEASGIAVAFGPAGLGHAVLQGADLQVERGAFVSLIGPSGCGKSTLLKVLAGLVEPSAGDVRVSGLAPREAARRRLIGFVFQDANLLPWKTALDNASFLLEIAEPARPRRQTRERAREILGLVGLDAAVEKRPAQLSGGMRQRVAIARALALDPEILLMDEPFGALDAITREEMGYFLLELWERTGKTIVLVTHSIDEAVLLSCEVHVMGGRPARILQGIPVGLGYPRGEESFADPAFTALELRLRQLLLEGHARRRRA
jgi:NitT/TauT family transport system ATP-binding protein